MLAASVCDTARIPSNDARRVNADRRSMHVLDPLVVVGRHHPVTDGDIGADVAHAQRLGDAARLVHRADHRAPAPVESRHPPRVARRPRVPATRRRSRRPTRAQRSASASINVPTSSCRTVPAMRFGQIAPAHFALTTAHPTLRLTNAALDPLAKGTDAQATRRRGVARQGQDAVEVPRQRLRRARLGGPRRATCRRRV